MSDPYLLEKCCVVGEAVGGDPTHFMIQRAIDRLELDWRMMSFQVEAARLGEAIVGADALGFRGVRLLGASRDHFAADGISLGLTARAGRTGRVTHLTQHEGRLQGDDATGPAFVEALAPLGTAAGKRVALLGAGGSAPSVADVLVEQGVAALAIADFSVDAAWRLTERLKQRVHDDAGAAARTDAAADVAPPPPAVEVTALRWEPGWLELPDGCDWIVSVASWPKEDNDRVAETLAPELGERHVVVDLAIGSNRSHVLMAAEQRGAAIVDGLPVLVGETALAIEAWTGEPIDRGILRDAAEEFLGV